MAIGYAYVFLHDYALFCLHGYDSGAGHRVYFVRTFMTMIFPSFLVSVLHMFTAFSSRRCMFSYTLLSCDILLIIVEQKISSKIQSSCILVHDIWSGFTPPGREKLHSEESNILRVI